MINITERQYGKDYADNLIDYLLTFNSSQTWSATSGTGSATLDVNKSFEGASSLRIENTAPTTDLVVTNSVQSSAIDSAGDYVFSLYALKSEVDEFLELEVNVFKNAVSLDTQTLTIGSETTAEDVNDKWVRFMTPIYTFAKGDVVTFTFTLKAKSGTSLITTNLWLDGLMISKCERYSSIPPLYTLPLDKPLYNVHTGWAQYGDSQYTSGSPLTCPLSTSTTVDIDGLGDTIKTQIPLGVTDLYDVSTSKILPVSSGDGFMATLVFKAETTSNTGYATVSVDIGGAIGEIFQQTLTFPKGSGTEHSFMITIIGYQLDTFLANGGVIKMLSEAGAVSMYDISLQIHRTHKSR